MNILYYLCYLKGVLFEAVYMFALSVDRYLKF
jgi:hypothetical protein